MNKFDIYLEKVTDFVPKTISIPEFDNMDDLEDWMKRHQYDIAGEEIVNPETNETILDEGDPISNYFTSKEKVKSIDVNKRNKMKARKAAIARLKAAKERADDKILEGPDVYEIQEKIAKELKEEYKDIMIDTANDYMGDNPNAKFADVDNYLHTATGDLIYGLSDEIVRRYGDDLRKVKRELNWDWKGWLADEVYDRALKYLEKKFNK